jgi:predicted PurR-regulated permease PerM
VGLAAFVLWRSVALLALLYAGAMLAVVLDRPVAALTRRGLARAWALALVLAGACLVAAVAGVVAVGPLVAQARALAAAAPDIADHVRAALVDRLGGALSASPLGTSVRDALSHGAGSLAGGVYDAMGGVANAAGALAAVLVLAVLLLASGPGLVRRFVDALPPERRSWAEALAHDLATSLGGYFAGLGTIMAARALATATFLALARAPFVIPLALVAGASVLVPYLGSVLRFATIGAVTWAADGVGAGLVSISFVALYDVLENYVISPLVFRKRLGVGALAQLVAVLFLGYHLGVTGAVLAIPLLATVQILVRALRSPASHLAAAARGDALPEAFSAPPSSRAPES